jgi:hypothetical protein
VTKEAVVLGALTIALTGLLLPAIGQEKGERPTLEELRQQFREEAKEILEQICELCAEI